MLYKFQGRRGTTTDERLSDMEPKEYAEIIAQEAIESIDFMTVAEALSFDYDIDDDDVAEEVMNIITTQARAVIEDD